MTDAVDETASVCSDAALIGAVRRGSTSAYGELYKRHVGAARRAALALVPARAEQEDLVAEAFTRVLRVLRSGLGPDAEFRPYLLVTMRNAVISAYRRRGNVTLYAEVPQAALNTTHDDPMSLRAQAEVVAKAFASLPERWRTVLWHTEVECEPPAVVAPLLGLTPNGVAALACRAREGLRRAYLRQYLPATTRRGCRAVADQLPGWVRRGMPQHTTNRVRSHLSRCADCRELTAALTRVNHELRGVLAPLILGAPFALAYLSTSALTSTAAALTVTTSTVPCITTIKTVLAGAAVATVTAAVTVAANPVPVPHDPGASASRPGTRQPTPATPPEPTRTATTNPDTVPTPTSSPVPSSPGADRKATSAPNKTNTNGVLPQPVTAAPVVLSPECPPQMVLPCRLTTLNVPKGHWLGPTEP